MKSRILQRLYIGECPTMKHRRKLDAIRIENNKATSLETLTFSQADFRAH